VARIPVFWTNPEKDEKKKESGFLLLAF